MAWSMPTTNQWASGMALAPDMNTGNYTAEQWAAMQQQHWQQWAQWQQQYATWQSQYGTKYAEQMQVIQTMGGMPPLPPATAAPPPAPPPPDKPPPPPHENNQPLYGNAQHHPTPVMAPAHNNAPANNVTDTPAGNIQNRSYATDTHSEVAQSLLNSEALKMLAEEEKAFDIQFQKWEEEIENWKKANVNHPDKKAYEQYEEKFETCRARLLERRQQMKLKRAKLLGNTQQPPNSVPRHNLSVPPPAIVGTSTNMATNKDPSNFQSQNFNKNLSQISSTVPQKDYRREFNTSFDPQDRYESYMNTSTTSISNRNLVSTEPFLQTTEPSKGIPGLDLVPDSDKINNRAPEIIDITDDFTKNQNRNVQHEPDYSKISKGINNILGDEKIMNILSMVRGQNQGTNNTQGPHPGNIANNSNNYWEGNETQNNNFRMGQSVPPYNMKQKNDYSMQQVGNQGSEYTATQSRMYRSDDLHQGQYHEEDQQFNNSIQPQMPQMPQRQMPPRPNPARQMQQNVRPNVPMRSLLDPLPPQNDFTSGGFDRRAMQECPPRSNLPVRPPPPPRPSWVDEPLFTPSIIVEYEHKPLRLKARDFIEPVHTFDYNHQSKDSDEKKKDFKKEVDGLFANDSRAFDRDHYSDRHRELYYRDHDRTSSRDHLRDTRDDHYSKGLIRDEYGERRRYEDDIRDKRYDDRRRDDREKFNRREDLHRERDRDRDDMFRDRDRNLERIRDRERDIDRIRDRDSERGRERDRDMYKDRPRDYRRSRSHDKDSRKRGHSKDSEPSSVSSSKKLKDVSKPKHMVMIDDILEPPGRHIRPEKIVIILRGPPGSGKSYLAKLIREREAEYGGTVRVMSIDDYFMQEGEIEEKDPTTGKIVKKPSLKYEYDEHQEENYIQSLKRAFKRSITDGYFTFLIYDAVNDQLRSYADIWNFARQNNFQVYICTMDLDPQACYKRNIHNRRLEEIEVVCSRFFPTPDHHIQLDPTTLLQSASITEVQMEDVDDDIIMEDAQETEVDNSFTSKWEKMDDAAQLARLDGTSKPLRSSQLSMEDYLQLDDWKPNTSKPGKKTVRWADIEERRQQEKMRAIGFVVGQTDWNRMTDPTMGSSALTQTKYIERVRRT